ncbi:uncharacterized protein LOC134268844, partial [Saccostrea cucullata]|uniref:uncharacterized protein LOC134268844 n=1 Tax=Saccostrea cuccullata TaxID=36930 RepID=UPI002ECFE3E3
AGYLVQQRTDTRDLTGLPGYARVMQATGLEKTQIIHTRKSRESRDEGYHSSERPKTYTKEREPKTFREPISYRIPEPRSRVIMTNKGKKPLTNGLIPLPETDRSIEAPKDVEKVDFRAKEPKEKKEREPISFREPIKKKAAEKPNQMEGKTPRDAPPAAEVARNIPDLPILPRASLRIDDLKDDFLTCEVCKSEYDEKEHTPRVLPCLHTFCNRCLEKHVRDWFIYCPSCKSQHTLPNDSVKNFPKENTRRTLRDFVQLKKKTKIPCRDCPDGGIAGFFCKDCYSFMCFECRKAHLRNFMSRSHTITPVDQLTNSGIEPFLRQQTCDMPGHEGQQLVYYCTRKGCEKPVCKMCTVLDHDETSGHNTRRLADVYEDHKAVISNLTKDMEDRITFTKNVMFDTEEEMKNLDKKYLDITKDIDKEIDESIQMLEVRRRELKDTLKGKCKDKRAILQKQRESLKYTLVLMNAGKEFSSHIMAHAMPAEFVILTDTISARLSMLKDKQIESCPLENSFLAFDKNHMGSEFKVFAVGMGKIRSTAIYPPKTMAEAFDVPVDNEAEVMKLFLYDSKGVPQKDSFDCVQVEIRDPKGRMNLASVEDAKTVDGCYRVYYTASQLGQHRALVKVLDRLVKEDGYPFNARTPGEIDKRYGDITCPGFTFDIETAHAERDVAPDGRVLRSDVTTLKRKTIRGLKKPRVRSFPWDDNGPIKQDTAKAQGRLEALSLDAHLDIVTNDKTFEGKRLKKYCGVVGTKPFRTPGRYYYEVNVSYRIHVNLVRNALIFEIGIGRWESIHNSFYVGAQMFAWSFSAERCNEHKQLCHKFRHKRTLLLHSPISADVAGTNMSMSYGFLLDTDNRQWTVIDCASQKVLYTFRNLDFTEPLWPVFGTYNPYSAHVEMHLKSGSSIAKIPAIATLV